MLEQRAAPCFSRTTTLEPPSQKGPRITRCSVPSRCHPDLSVATTAQWSSTCQLPPQSFLTKEGTPGIKWQGSALHSMPGRHLIPSRRARSVLCSALLRLRRLAAVIVNGLLNRRLQAVLMVGRMKSTGLATCIFLWYSEIPELSGSM